MGVTFSHGNVERWTYGTYHRFLVRLAAAAGIELDQMEGQIPQAVLHLAAEGKRTVESLREVVGTRSWREIKDDIKPLLTGQKSISPRKCPAVAQRLRQLVQDWSEDEEADPFGTFDKQNALRLADALETAGRRGEIFYIDSDGPKRPAKRKRPARLCVLLTEEERLWIEQQVAAQGGIPKGSYVRSLVYTALNYPPPPAGEERDAVSQPPLLLDFAYETRDRVHRVAQKAGYSSAAAFVRGVLRWQREAAQRKAEMTRILLSQPGPDQSLDTWVALGQMAAADVAQVRELLTHQTGILIVGQPGIGKTMLLGALLNEGPETSFYLSDLPWFYSSPSWAQEALRMDLDDVLDSDVLLYHRLAEIVPQMAGKEIIGVDEIRHIGTTMAVFMKAAGASVIATLQERSVKEAYQWVTALLRPPRRGLMPGELDLLDETGLRDWVDSLGLKWRERNCLTDKDASAKALFPWCLWIEQVGPSGTGVHSIKVRLLKMGGQQEEVEMRPLRTGAVPDAAYMELPVAGRTIYVPRQPDRGG